MEQRPLAPSRIISAHEPSVVAVLVRELALLYAQGLALGDADPLRILNVQTPPKFDPRSREWGVGQREDGDYVLVVCHEGEVEWSLFPGILPLAHSHPYEVGFVNAAVGAGNLQHDVAFGQGIHLLNLINELLTLPAGVVDYTASLTRLLPSNQDIRANYAVGGRLGLRELLFTPYRYDSHQGTLSIDPAHPGLVITFGPALGVRRQTIPEVIAGYHEVVSLFVSPIAIGYGLPNHLTQIWSGWLTCGWADQAGGMALCSAPPPGRAQSASRPEVEEAVSRMGRKIPPSAMP
jgi:hypothetical protein